MLCMPTTKCEDLSTFWFVCAILCALSWIGFAIIIVLQINGIVDSQFFFMVGFSVMVNGIFIYGLLVQHYRKSHQVGFDVWTWSILAITTFECWALLSAILNTICYIFALNDFLIASPGDDTTPLWFRFVSNVCIYGFALTLHIYILIRKKNHSHKDRSWLFVLVSEILHSYYTTAVPIDLFRLPDVSQFDNYNDTHNKSNNNSNSNLQEPLLANDSIATARKKKSTVADLGSEEAEILFHKGAQITTGWRIFTWQGLAMQLYFMASQLVGIEQLEITWSGHVFFYCLYIIVHALIVTVAIRLCRWFLRELDDFAESPHMADVGIPFIFGFFAIMFRWWHIPCTILMITQPEALDILLAITWQDGVIWIFQGTFVVIEMYAIYLMFKIVFLKHIPVDSKKLTPKQHLIILHVYYAILAYGTITILISIVSVFFNAKMFYQFMLSLDFAIYGKYILCDEYGPGSESHGEDSDSESLLGLGFRYSEITTGDHDTSDTSDTSDDHNDYSYCHEELSHAYDAYYYFCLLFFFSLGRANSISFLWRTIGTVWDSLKERRSAYVDHLSTMHSGYIQENDNFDDMDDNDNDNDNENTTISLKEMENKDNDEDSGHQHGDGDVIKHNHGHDHDEMNGMHEKKQGGSQLSRAWLTIILFTILIGIFMSTRFSYQYKVTSLTVYIWEICSSVSYVGLLGLIMKNIHDKHKLRCAKTKRSYFDVHLRPSQWMFIIASCMTVAYQLLLTFYSDVHFRAVHGVAAVVSLQQIFIGVTHGNLVDQSDARLAIIICINLILMIYSICVDLGEQLEFVDELDESEDGEYNVEIEGVALVTTSIFFANLEHYWGVIESCQEALIHKHSHHHHHES